MLARTYSIQASGGSITHQRGIRVFGEAIQVGSPSGTLVIHRFGGNCPPGGGLPTVTTAEWSEVERSPGMTFGHYDWDFRLVNLSPAGVDLATRTIRGPEAALILVDLPANDGELTVPPDSGAEIIGACGLTVTRAFRKGDVDAKVSRHALIFWPGTSVGSSFTLKAGDKVVRVVLKELCEVEVQPTE